MRRGPFTLACSILYLLHYVHFVLLVHPYRGSAAGPDHTDLVYEQVSASDHLTYPGVRDHEVHRVWQVFRPGISCLKQCEHKAHVDG
jgi:hypothetical protein